MARLRLAVDPRQKGWESFLQPGLGPTWCRAFPRDSSVWQ